MKRFVTLAVLLLLLCGCSPEVPRQSTGTSTAATTAATTEATQPPQEDPGCYLPDSQAERQTDGALRAYSLRGYSVIDVVPMGEKLLVFSGCSTGMEVTVLTGDNCAVEAVRQLPGCMSTNAGVLRTGSDGLGYYDGDARCVVVLDGQLKELRRVALPETTLGFPVISGDLSTAFYSTADQIHAIDLTTGISRMICQYSFQWQSPENSFFGDSVLQCHIITDDDGGTASFLSTENGQILGEDPNLLSLFAQGDRFFLTRQEGFLRECLFGTSGGELQVLQPLELGLCPSDSLEEILGFQAGEEGLRASVYELSTGLRTAALELPELSGVYIARMDSRGFAWFCAYDPQTQQDMLYRWDPARSPSGDTQCYTAPRYTRENPDTQGLAQLTARAEALAEAYGIRILLGEAIPMPWDYSLTTEFRTDALAQGLDQLERALAAYPEGFLTRMVENSPGRILTVSLVRSISPTAGGLQYWVEGDACIALALSETVEQNFYHEVSHVLDSFIIANCMLYDDWEELNPEGAVYDYSYDIYNNRADRTWLEGEQQAFLDSYSMTYPREDRARILEYAMTPGNARYFQPRYLQEKLLQICKAIRESYGWKRSEETYPWEQYLTTSLAYKKK